MTEEQAIQLSETKWWESKTHREIAEFQLFEEMLCCPFGVFHEAVEKALGRPVYTHEFAFMDGLQKELLGERPPPTMQEILDLIPEAKRIIVVAP